MFEKIKKLIEEAKKRAVQSVDPEVFNHPLAKQVDWHPLKGGGANFQTHRLDHSNQDVLIFKATKGALLFCGVFTFVGLLVMVIPSVVFLVTEVDEWGMVLFAVLFGGVFFGVGILMYYFMTAPRVFDTFYGCYYKGRKKPQHTMRQSRMGLSKADEHATKNKQALIQLSDVKAIQLIRERISSKNGSYHSYEINLVLADASRVNVIDHGKHEAVVEDAEILATNLGVPLWDAS